MPGYTYEEAEEFFDILREDVPLQQLYEAHTGKRYDESNEADIGRWIYRLSAAIREEAGP